MPPKYVKSVKYEINEPKKEIFTAEDLKYIDPENLAEEIVKFEFFEFDDNEMFLALANLLKLQYRLPVKYLKPVEGSFRYIAQKSQLTHGQKDLRTANLTIEPLNPNFPQCISYLPINQFIPLNTLFTLHTEIPYRSNSRKMLTSASLVCEAKNIKEKITEEAKKSGFFKNNDIPTALFNRRVAFGAVEIGSVLDCKFSVQFTDIHESFSLFRFRRPADNVIIFIYYKHMCINIKYILNLMKFLIFPNKSDDRAPLIELTGKERDKLGEVLDEMMAAA